MFEEAVSEINYRDYDLRSPMDRRRGPIAKYFGFHQFQFLGGLSESLLFGCAIIDLRFVSQAFLYLYEPLSRQRTEFRVRMPLSWGTHFDQRPEDGSVTLRSGQNRFAMTATSDPQQRHLWVRLEDGTEVDAVFHEDHPRIQPMWISTPAGADGFVFARKTAGARVTGTIRSRGRSFNLAELDMLGHNDWSAGYMRRDTVWNWGCLAGRLADGRVVGLNVSCGVNETGRSENCFWIDGAIHRLGPVAFDFDRRDLMKPWRMRDSQSRLDLEFIPEGSHHEKVNALVVATNFHQLCGRYHGTMRTSTDETIAVQGLLGYAEKHFARW